MKFLHGAFTIFFTLADCDTVGEKQTRARFLFSALSKRIDWVVQVHWVYAAKFFSFVLHFHSSRSLTTMILYPSDLAKHSRVIILGAPRPLLQRPIAFCPKPALLATFRYELPCSRTISSKVRTTGLALRIGPLSRPRFSFGTL